MKKTAGCEYADRIKFSKQDKNTQAHIAVCAECRESQMVFDWMQNFAAETAAPRNLPAPGFLLFKARLLRKQSAANRAVQPIFWMQIVAAVLLVSAGGWLLSKNETPVGSILKETFSSLLSAAPLFVVGVSCAIVICFVFYYFLRETNK